MNYRNQQGFTLIELMIVVVIVAILASLSYPSYREYVRRSARAEAKAALLENAQFMERNFTAANRYDEDSAGNALSGRCTYDIVGLTPPARLWTLHATTPDGLPVKLAANLPAGLNSWTTLREAEGRIVVHVAPTAQPGNWLATAPDQPFRLVMTLLDTPTAGSSGVIDLSMPSIERTGCADA